MDSGGDEYVNPITAVKRFQRAVADAENLDTNVLLDTARTCVEQSVGPRRPGESTAAHRTRAFAYLLESCGPAIAAATTVDGGHITMYAATAADAGRVDTARKWYERLVVDSGGWDADYWLLCGALDARCGRSAEALACARTAVAVDSRHRVALFVHVATLMTAAAVECCDELETSLRRLAMAYPQFGEGHVLAALHWRRMEMPDREAGSLSLAVRELRDDVPARPVTTTWWRPEDRSLETDAVVRCATLLAELELIELATTCLLCYGRPDVHPYHYLMAVVHHKRGEFDASAEHLCRVDATCDADGRLSLLAANNHYGLGCLNAATDVYAELAGRRPPRQHFALAYTRLAEQHASKGRHVEAVDLFCLACRVAKTPALLIAMAASLVALRQHAEAEKLLAEAVAGDVADNADVWRYLAVVNDAAGHADLAEVCRQHADRIISD